MGNVRYLLDTCTFLWSVQKDVELSKNARAIIENTDYSIFLSAVSAYEIMYKHKIGKLFEYDGIASNYFKFVKKLGVVELSLKARHAHLAGKLEWSHRDPFDRLLAAQAHIENLTLITDDEAFTELSWIKTLW